MLQRGSWFVTSCFLGSNMVSTFFGICLTLPTLSISFQISCLALLSHWPKQLYLSRNKSNTYTEVHPTSLWCEIKCHSHMHLLSPTSIATGSILGKWKLRRLATAEGNRQGWVLVDILPLVPFLLLLDEESLMPVLTKIMFSASALKHAIIEQTIWIWESK